MAPPVRDSISSSERNRETFRDTTRDFLLKANGILNPSSSNTNNLSRYYQLHINSLLDLDQDDIDYLLKTSEANVRCVKCGNHKDLRLVSRKRENRSTYRRHCRYLRSKCIEYCNKCNNSKKHKLFGRQAIYDKLKRNLVATKINNKRKVKSTSPSVKQQTVKHFLKRTSHSKPHQQPPVPQPAQKITPQFSSRLRAFSCLLEQ